ncbi:MAG TPA: OmpA family protein [Flavisolibacter sp.]|nr:OmpA family protein [Flavisolibacter sp.]
MKTLMLSMASLLTVFYAGAQDNLRKAILYFPFDKASLTMESKLVLDSLVQELKGIRPAGPITITGHCDALGSDEYNDRLSAARVGTVAAYLKGLDNSLNILASSYGEKQPVNGNATPGERQLNRRVELSFTIAEAPQPEKLDTPPPPPPAEKLSVRIDSVKVGETIRLRNINFIGGSSKLLSTSLPALEELYQVMSQNPSLVIEIQGHICCLFNGQDGNDFEDGSNRLSQNRARTVYEYLVEKGISRNRMSYQGFAGTKPLIYPERTEADRTANRRVEIKIAGK